MLIIIFFFACLLQKDNIPTRLFTLLIKNQYFTRGHTTLKQSKSSIFYPFNHRLKMEPFKKSVFFLNALLKSKMLHLE